MLHKLSNQHEDVVSLHRAGLPVVCLLLTRIMTPCQLLISLLTAQLTVLVCLALLATVPMSVKRMLQRKETLTHLSSLFMPTVCGCVCFPQHNRVPHKKIRVILRKHSCQMDVMEGPSATNISCTASVCNKKFTE